MSDCLAYHLPPQGNLKILMDNRATLRNVLNNGFGSFSVSGSIVTQDEGFNMIKENAKATKMSGDFSINLALAESIPINAFALVTKGALDPGLQITVTGSVGSASGSCTTTLDQETTNLWQDDILWGANEWYGAAGHKLGNIITAWLPWNINKPALVSNASISVSGVTSEFDIQQLFIGRHFSPGYNLSKGHSMSFHENSTKIRTESGSLRATSSGIYRKFNFVMNLLTERDRKAFTDMYYYCGNSHPVVLSLFPYDENKPKAKDYTVMGYFASTPKVKEVAYNYYSMGLEIEEA